MQLNRRALGVRGVSDVSHRFAWGRVRDLLAAPLHWARFVCGVGDDAMKRTNTLCLIAGDARTF